MFQRHFQPRRGAAQRVEDGAEEHVLAVENIDTGVGDLAVETQRQADLGHRLQHAPHIVEIGYARGGIGRGPRRVEFHRRDQAARMGGGDIRRVGFLGQVERHQRREIRALGQGGEDPVAVASRIRPRHHRRHQVRHDDGAGEIAGAFGQDGPQHRAVAQMQVPVIGAAERQGVGHGLPVTRGKPPLQSAKSRGRGDSRAFAAVSGALYPLRDCKDEDDRHDHELSSGPVGRVSDADR